MLACVWDFDKTLCPGYMQTPLFKAFGVDEELFRPLPHVARIPGRLMTTASADVPLKGLTVLLDALAKVRVECPDAHLVVIGRLKDGSAVPALIEQLGLGDAVEFVSGVTDERIVELYAEAEVAVVPSLYEGFSLPAAEAMACEVAVVATTGGALPEVVGVDGDCARTVEPGDPSALAARIIEVLGDEKQRATLGRRGRQRVLERFTWRTHAEGLVETWRAELAARSQGAVRSAHAHR